jgi:RimJ/RimL family protein N-acetyltransferase
MRDLLPEGWSTVDVIRQGEVVGFFCTKDNEIHCWRDESHKGRWITRQDLERLTAPLFARFGHIKTSVRLENRAGHHFVSRLGFIETGRDDNLVFYKCERLKHARL